MIKSLIDINSVDEIGTIIKSIGFITIQNILSQYVLGNIKYVITNLNITQYKYLSSQIRRLTSKQKNTILFKTFILNTIQLLYSCLQQVSILNQNSADLASNAILLEILKDKEKLLAYIEEMNKTFTIFPNQTITTTNVKLKPEYQIYINNQYNIGNTIAQIKYIINIPKTPKTPKTLKTVTHDTHQPLLYNIVKSFIKKYIKLSTINNALEIRKFLYTLISLNINLIEFIKLLVKQLIRTNPQYNQQQTLSNNENDFTYNYNISFHIKQLIISEAGKLSHDILTHNKEIINIETFIYKIIHIIYSDITI